MKKTVRAVFVSFLVVVMLVGCSKKEADSGQTTSTDAASAISVAETASTVDIANPWREVSAKDELETILDTAINIPVEAENVVYQLMDSDGLCEVRFDYKGRDCTYRIKKADQEEDISGMYYAWSEIETVDFYGCEATYRKCAEDGEDLELGSWHNEEHGLMYSLSAAGSGDSFELWDLAEELYGLPDDIQTQSLLIDDPYKDILVMISKAVGNKDSMYLSGHSLTGVMEMMGNPSAIGYSLQDIDMNGVDELIIAADEPDTYPVPRILAIYTVENGNAVQLADGWYRNRYFLLEDGRLVNEGSGGAAYSVISLQKINNAGTGLDTIEHYFTEPIMDANGVSTGVAWYFNTTGDSDIANSVQITDEAEIANMHGRFDAERVTYELHPLP